MKGVSSLEGSGPPINCSTAMRKGLQLAHVDLIGSEIPEHLDEVVRKGVEVDMELAVYEPD